MRKFLLFVVVSAILGIACDRNYTPKPRSFFRIDYPEKNYQLWEGDCPFTFEYPAYSGVYQDTSFDAEPCWKHIYYRPFDAYLHLSYKPVTDFNGFHELREDARTFVYEHTVKASDIQEYSKALNETTMGTVYELKGEAASALQFYVTDTNNHYIRGALYFNAPTQRDSLEPVIEFLKEDVEVFMESVEWQE